MDYCLYFVCCGNGFADIYLPSAVSRAHEYVMMFCVRIGVSVPVLSRLQSVRWFQLSQPQHRQSLIFSTTRPAQCTLVWPASAQTLQWPLPQPALGTTTSTMQSRTQVCAIVEPVCRGISQFLTHRLCWSCQPSNDMLFEQLLTDPLHDSWV